MDNELDETILEELADGDASYGTSTKIKDIFKKDSKEVREALGDDPTNTLRPKGQTTLSDSYPKINKVANPQNLTDLERNELGL